jgi:hypothetical protein
LFVALCSFFCPSFFSPFLVAFFPPHSASVLHFFFSEIEEGVGGGGRDGDGGRGEVDGECGAKQVAKKENCLFKRVCLI